MITDNLQKLLSENNLTLEQLSSLSQVPLETIRNILYKRALNPRIDTIVAIARALNVSVEELIMDTQDSDISRLLSRYCQCNPHGKQLLNLIAEIESDMSCRKKRTSDINQIPCIEVHTAYADAIPYQACSFKAVSAASSQAFLALKMPDNRYAPVMCADDILLFENRFPNDGETALFYYEGMLYLRYLRQYEDGYVLAGLCGRSPDIRIVRMDQYLLIGTYIGISRL